MAIFRWRATVQALAWVAGLGQVGWAADESHGSSGAALPVAVAAEIGQVDAMERAIRTGQPIGQWRFDAVRAGYQAILNRAGEDPAVEEALRDRLARLTRQEQAAQAARTIEMILAQSRRRDAAVARVRQRLAASGGARVRAYSAVGLIQPSSRMVDGRRLHALIGPSGSTMAYLDIPPGLDLQPLLARRVGVRGTTHYDPDLGARLISVRDLESIEATR